MPHRGSKKPRENMPGLMFAKMPHRTAEGMLEKTKRWMRDRTNKKTRERWKIDAG